MALSVRFLRIFRIIRVLRAIKSVKNIIYFTKKKTRSIFNISLITSFLLCIVTALSMYVLEQEHSESAFDTFEKCIWWTLFTFSSVGYADVLPETNEGLFFSLLLTVNGIILLATTIGYVVDINIEDEETNKRLKSVEDKLEEIKKSINKN